jgi:hypothetical protein
MSDENRGPAQQFEHASIMYFSWIQAIRALLSALENREPVAPGDAPQTTPSENGLSAGIVVLTVLALESALARVRYVRGDPVRPAKRKLSSSEGPEREPFTSELVDELLGKVATSSPTPATLKVPRSPVEYFKMLEAEAEVPNEDRLGDDIEEAFVLRDALAHNHIWESQIIWDQKGSLGAIAWRLHPGYGNDRFRRVVDQETVRTHRLGLNAYPTRVWRHDAFVVWRMFLRALRWLESLKREYAPISLLIDEIRDGEVVGLADFLREADERVEAIETRFPDSRSPTVGSSRPHGAVERRRRRERDPA